MLVMVKKQNVAINISTHRRERKLDIEKIPKKRNINDSKAFFNELPKINANVRTAEPRGTINA
jgi:hypothetical protein